MKFAVGVVLCFIFATVLAVTSEEELTEKLKAASKKCQSDPATAVDEEAMKTYYESKGKAEKPANLGPHSVCMSKVLGLQNADGTVNKEHLKERLTARIHDAAKVDEIMTECAVQKEDDIATASHLFRCFMKHAKEEVH